MNIKPMSITMALRIEPELKEKLKELACEQGIEYSSLIRNILWDYVNRKNRK